MDSILLGGLHDIKIIQTVHKWQSSGEIHCRVECSCQNITFVEKYTSFSVSGGTVRVATSVSYFGGLGQLYRVKVWAVVMSLSHKIKRDFNFVFKQSDNATECIHLYNDTQSVIEHKG